MFFSRKETMRRTDCRRRSGRPREPSWNSRTFRIAYGRRCRAGASCQGEQCNAVRRLRDLAPGSPQKTERPTVKRVSQAVAYAVSRAEAFTPPE